MSSAQQKTFQTPIMAGIYLGHSTEPADVYWDPLPLASGRVREAGRQHGIGKVSVRAHRRRRVSHGHAIRKLLVTP
jgi:hypothetical protein